MGEVLFSGYTEGELVFAQLPTFDGVHRGIRIETGAGNDLIQLQRVRVRGTVVRQTPILDAGAGENQIDREPLLSWDFNNGEQGW